MGVPDYQSIMLPLLRIASSGADHRIADLYDGIAKAFELSDAERAELLPSGKVSVLNNRVAWAKTYLVKAGLLDAPQRGIVKITQRGRELLDQNPPRIDVSFLNQYPEFVEFRNVSKEQTKESDADDAQGQTPEEILESAHKELRGTLVQELLVRVKSATPAFFERLVLDLLVAMGYGGSLEGAGKVVGKSGDEGIDGIIKEDRLGLGMIYLQAKRWDNVVGRPEIQKFVGALQGQRAKKGVFVTASSFSKEAELYASGIDVKVVLIGGQRLAGLMIDFDVGVSKVNSYITKRLDTDYFAEE